jgi:hypothetical protein
VKVSIMTDAVRAKFTQHPPPENHLFFLYHVPTTRYAVYMDKRPPRAARIGSIVWALLIGTGIMALGVSILLPSTKRARVHFPLPGEQPENTAATVPVTEPATQP